MVIYDLYDPRWLKNHLVEIAAYYFREWEDFQMIPHAHRRIEIMYVLKGSCRVGVKQEDLLLKKGDFILINGEVPHRLMVEKGCPSRILNIEFIFRPADDRESILPMLSRCSSLQNLISSHKPYVYLKDSQEVYRALRSLIMELDRKLLDQETMEQMLFAELILRIARMEKENKDNQNTPSSIYIHKAQEYMHQHYDRDIRISDIAEAVSIHEGYLHRLFKAHTGVTILRYLNTLRIEKAKMLLRSTDIPIIDICVYVGLNSRQHFTYLFKKLTGISPAEFRKNIDQFVGFDE